METLMFIILLDFLRNLIFIIFTKFYVPFFISITLVPSWNLLLLMEKDLFLTEN